MFKIYPSRPRRKPKIMACDERLCPLYAKVQLDSLTWRPLFFGSRPPSKELYSRWQRTRGSKHADWAWPWHGRPWHHVENFLFEYPYVTYVWMQYVPTNIIIHIYPAGPETVPIKRAFFFFNGDFTTVPCWFDDWKSWKNLGRVFWLFSVIAATHAPLSAGSQHSCECISIAKL